MVLVAPLRSCSLPLIQTEEKSCCPNCGQFVSSTERRSLKGDKCCINCIDTLSLLHKQGKRPDNGRAVEAKITPGHFGPGLQRSHQPQKIGPGLRDHHD